MDDGALAQAAALVAAGKCDEAAPLVVSLLNGNPDDPKALFMAGVVHASAGRFGMAIAFLRQCVALAPKRAEPWNNLGMALESIGRCGDAREAFERALSLSPGHATYIANLALTWLQEGDAMRAVNLAEQALRIDPGQTGARVTRGFARLQTGRWAEGAWDDVSLALGGKYRKRLDYGLPEWTGQDDAHVIVYGEQGLGDEILYASCLPDVVERARKVTLDCDERLAGLFARSFPTVEVHGTRRAEGVPWLGGQTHQIAIGELPRLFRYRPTDCPGHPYLSADPDRHAMYDALQARHDRGLPRIGIAWTGGTAGTAGHRRRLDPALFAPLTERAALFSLQYDDPGPAWPALHWQRATGRGVDFDETAAFIAALDGVIAVDTTAAHAAGALGVPTIVLVHDRCNWICASWQVDRSVWYGSVQFFRQLADEPWADTMARFLRSEMLDRFMGAL